MPTRVQISDAQLFVEDSGERDLPIVLCLHSLFLDGRMFDGFAAAARGRYRVVVPDWRGQGRNPSSDADIITMDEYADDVEEVVNALELGPVHLLMQSMGGDVGFRFAKRRLDQVKSMVVLGSSACAEPPGQLEEFRAFVDEVRVNGFQGEFLDTMMEVMFGATTRRNPEKADMLAHYRREIAALPPALAPAFAGVIERGSVVADLPALTAPTLVVSGSEDMPRPPAWADEVHENLPHSELWRLEGVGHSPILEDPEEVLPRILAFFDAAESALGGEA